MTRSGACSFLFILLVLIGMAPKSFGQNLVRNGDFETKYGCPGGSSDIVYDTTFSVFPTVADWISPTFGTPDYYHTCATKAILSVPNGWHGYQQPRSGSAYAGIFAYSYTNYDYREFLTTKLSRPMVRDSVYCVRFFVSLGSALAATTIAVKDLGANFSATLPPYDPINKPNAPLSIPYDIINDTTRFLTDTAQWQEIRGTYVAKGGEEWMTIGSFGPQIPRYSEQFGSGSYVGAYYFLDDVSIMPVVPQDTEVSLTLCDSGLMLTSTRPTGPYKWNSGATTRSIYVTKAGNYSCIVVGDCEAFSTHFVVSNPPVFDSSIVLEICDTSKTDVLLTATPSKGPYLWSTGDTGRSIRVSRLGYYECSVLKDCRMLRDKFDVVAGNTEPPVLQDTIICQKVVAPILNVNDTGLVWYTQVSAGIGKFQQPVINTSQAGKITYYVAVRRGTCTSKRVPITVEVKALPEALPTKKVVHCEGSWANRIVLGSEIYSDLQFEWSTGDTGCCISPQRDGYFTRVASNGCGTAIDSFIIASEPCEHCVVLPDAFTPNNDGRNDEFRALVRCSIKDFHFAVHNRWGQPVFVTDEERGKWDGRHNGTTAPEGTYMYYVAYTSALTGMKTVIKGTVTLIR